MSPSSSARPGPPLELAGSLARHIVTSEVLAGNVLGDPTDRPLWIYTPPEYEADPGRRFPTVYLIQGYSGQVDMWFNRTPFNRPHTELVDAMIVSGQTPPVVMAYVDAWTTYGGSQFVDSPGTGRYHTYLCDEIVSFVDANYRTLASPDHRAITGKSSGGFGAMITPMLRPDLFGALASHAGDTLYEYCYLPDFARSVRALRAYDGDIWKWWAEFQSRPGVMRPDDMSLIGTLGCGACFSADDDGTPQLPFDPRNGRLHPERWRRWLDWDPVVMAPKYADALRGLRGIWIDAGTQDDFALDVGAQAFHDTLLDIGVSPDVLALDLHEGRHGGTSYRYPLALSWLAERISP